MSQNVSSAAVVIGALRVKKWNQVTESAAKQPCTWHINLISMKRIKIRKWNGQQYRQRKTHTVGPQDMDFLSTAN